MVSNNIEDLNAFMPISTDGVWALSTIAVPVIGILLILFFGKIVIKLIEKRKIEKVLSWLQIRIHLRNDDLPGVWVQAEEAFDLLKDVELSITAINLE